jgi:hypothetical protein
MDYRSGPARIAGMGLLETSSPIGLCAIDDGSGGGGGAGGAVRSAARPDATVVPADPAAVVPGSGGGGEGRRAATAVRADPAPANLARAILGRGRHAENPSNRDWLKAKGFKTVDDLAKSYREAEHAIRNGGKFNVPGDDAKPEEIAAYHKAIGVPEKAGGLYDHFARGREGRRARSRAARWAEGRRAQERDAGESLRRSRRRVHPEAARRAAGLGDGREQQSRRAVQGMGRAKGCENGRRHRGHARPRPERADVAAIQRGFALQYGEPGSKRTLELLQKLGAGMAEDVLRNPDASARKFGVTPEQAQAEIDKLIADAEFGKKLTAKDPEAVARWTGSMRPSLPARTRAERAPPLDQGGL